MVGSFLDHVAVGTTFFEQADPLRIYLAHDDTQSPDWQLASECIKPLPGNVVCESFPSPSKLGQIYLPERALTTYHDDLGNPIAGFEASVSVVLAAGKDVDLEPGQKVVVFDGDGLEMQNFTAGRYAAKEVVRMYGLVVPEGEFEEGYVESLPWEESILGVLGGNTIETLKPTGSNVLVRKDAYQEQSETGLIIPDVAQERSSIATVIAVGSGCRYVKPGDRVVYHPLAEISFYGEDPDMRMIREKAILTVIEEAA